jgi:Tfp pilus assembly protein PilW
MSKSKDQTENIPPLSSGESTGETAQPSSPSVSTDNTQTFMQTTKPPSLNTSQSGKNGLTTPDNTSTTPVTEKTRQHAMLVRVALKALKNAGLIKRYEVRSTDPTTGATTVLEIRYGFDTSVWTESLELK